MRFASVVLAALFCAHPVHAQPTAPITRTLPNMVPADARVDQLVTSADQRRTYYTDATGNLFRFDRATKTIAKLADAPVWDLSLSRVGNAIAYTRISRDDRTKHLVWVLPLSSTSGIASAPERLVSKSPGDVPSISPDGKWIAFARDDSTGVGQSVVIVPIDGGRERVVAAAQPAGVVSIRWTPDGNTIYFGITAPVPFTCAESCLSLPPRARPTFGSIRRVAASGGPVSVVAASNNPSPGLSPDGSILVFGDTASRTFVVADNTGKRLQSLHLDAGHAPRGWTGASTLMTAPQVTIRRLSAVGVAQNAGTARTLLEISDYAQAPSFSPDGQFVALVKYVGDGCQMSIMRRDGSAARAIPIKSEGCGAYEWLSDGKHIMLTTYKEGNTIALTSVDLATGKSAEVRTLAGDAPQMISDNHDVIVAERTSSETFTVSLIAIDGTSTVLRKLNVTPNAFVWPVDRNRAIINVDRQVQLVDLKTGASRVLLAIDTGFISMPSVSADKQWVAFRVNPKDRDNRSMNRIELLALDGTSRRTLNLDMFAAAGAYNPLIVPGANTLVIAERQGLNEPVGVFAYDVATGVSRRMLSAAAAPALALSPDGRTVLMLTSETPSLAIVGHDLSTLRTNGRPR